MLTKLSKGQERLARERRYFTPTATAIGVLHIAQEVIRPVGFIHSNYVFVFIGNKAYIHIESKKQLDTLVNEMKNGNYSNTPFTDIDAVKYISYR